MFWKSHYQDGWKDGFKEGFGRAWEWMRPYMQESKEEVRKLIYEEAMDHTLEQLEPTIKKRLEALGKGI